MSWKKKSYKKIFSPCLAFLKLWSILYICIFSILLFFYSIHLFISFCLYLYLGIFIPTRGKYEKICRGLNYVRFALCLFFCCACCRHQGMSLFSLEEWVPWKWNFFISPAENEECGFCGLVLLIEFLVKWINLNKKSLNRKSNKYV